MERAARRIGRGRVPKSPDAKQPARSQVGDFPPTYSCLTSRLIPPSSCHRPFLITHVWVIRDPCVLILPLPSEQLTYTVYGVNAVSPDICRPPRSILTAHGVGCGTNFFVNAAPSSLPTGLPRLPGHPRNCGCTSSKTPSYSALYKSVKYASSSFQMSSSMVFVPSPVLVAVDARKNPSIRVSAASSTAV